MKIQRSKLLQPLCALAATWLIAVPASAALVAHYPLDGNADQTEPGGAPNGTLHANTTWTGGIAPGSSQSLQVAATGAENPGPVIVTGTGIWHGATGFSISAWIQPSEVTGTHTIVGIGTNTGGARLVLQLNGSGSLVVGGRANAGLGFASRVASGNPLTVGQTYHVAVTVDYTAGGGGAARAYINGELVDLYQGVNINNAFPTWAVGSTADGENLNIGIGANSNADANGERYRGLVDEVRLFNHVLSASEVAALAIPEPTASLLGAVGALGLLRRRRNG